VTLCLWVVYCLTRVPGVISLSSTTAEFTDLGKNLCAFLAAAAGPWFLNEPLWFAFLVVPLHLSETTL